MLKHLPTVIDAKIISSVINYISDDAVTEKNLTEISEGKVVQLIGTGAFFRSSLQEGYIASNNKNIHFA